MRFYNGMSLSQVERGIVPVQDAADAAAHLPRGGAVAEWVGGWAALTGEEEALKWVEWTIVAVNAEKKPKVPQPPDSIRELEARARRNRQKQSEIREFAKDYRK